MPQETLPPYRSAPNPIRDYLRSLFVTSVTSPDQYDLAINEIDRYGSSLVRDSPLGMLLPPEPIEATYWDFRRTAKGQGYAPNQLYAIFKGLVVIDLGQRGHSAFRDKVSDQLPTGVLQMKIPPIPEKFTEGKLKNLIQTATMDMRSLCGFTAAIHDAAPKSRTKHRAYMIEILPRSLGEKALACWSDVAAEYLRPKQK